jgi:hypothetical protein
VAERKGRVVWVPAPAHARIKQLAELMTEEKDREVTMGEVVSFLISIYDEFLESE